MQLSILRKYDKGRQKAVTGMKIKEKYNCCVLPCTISEPALSDVKKFTHNVRG
jgi:hypothetical protein